MGNKIFEEIKRKYKKSTEYMLYVSYEDIGKLIKIIEALEDRNKSNIRYIKELEEQHRQDCRIINIYIED